MCVGQIIDVRRGAAGIAKFFRRARAAAAPCVVAVRGDAIVFAEHMHSPAYANKGRKAISVPNVTLAVVRSLALPSSCVPHGAVMLSMATTHHKRRAHCAHGWSPLPPRARAHELRCRVPPRRRSRDDARAFGGRVEGEEA